MDATVEGRGPATRGLRACNRACKGPAQGLAAERALLLRQARKRFGEACAQALAPLLETRENPEELAEVGEWLVTYDTGEALLARVRGEV